MTIIKTDNNLYTIQISEFDICREDGKTKSEISKLYSRKTLNKKSCYYLDKFAKYLQDNFNLSLKEYCKKYLTTDWPICPVLNEEVGYRITGKGIIFSRYKQYVTKEFSEKFKIACDKMSVERIGQNNPMYGRQPWNKGLDISDPRIKSMAEARIGIHVSEETRGKMKLAREKSLKKARHTTKHSEETKNILREKTAKLWSDGIYNKTTSIHIKVRDFLNQNNITNYQEEYKVKYFSLDFAFPSFKVAIECQGTFFHIDPRVYPNGPICAIQRRNAGRDKAKRNFLCDQNGWYIIELWETEINNGSFEEILISKLQELGICNYKK